MPDIINMGTGDDRPALTPRQLEILAEFCDKIKYKKIAEALVIEEKTVRVHMRNIYIRLGLMDLDGDERRWRIREEICPGIRKGEFPVLPEEQDKSALVPVSPEDERKLDEDEEAILKLKEKSPRPPPIPPLSTRPRIVNRPRPGIWLIVGFILGLIAMYFAYPSLFASEPEELAEVAIPSATEDVNVPEKAEVVTPTPQPTQSTQTPIIEQQTVIVVATSIPATDTPAPPPLSIEELYAQDLPVPVSAGTILLEDDFSIENTWEIGFYSEYEDEELIIGDYYDNVSSDARTHLSFDNFILEVDARWADGPIGGRYGIGFRFQDPENYYEFLVSNDGRYLVTKYVNGFNTVLMDGFSGAISQQGIVNRFHLEGNGMTMRFFVNDEYLGSIEDEDFIAGDVLLLAETPENRNTFYAVFDNFILVQQP